MPPIDKTCICQNCNKQYNGGHDHKTRKFCSYKCNVEYRKKISKKPKTFICKHCKKLTKNKNHTKNPLYCSHICFGLSVTKKDVKRICKQCNKIFFVRPYRIRPNAGKACNFCSRKCSTQYFSQFRINHGNGHVTVSGYFSFHRDKKFILRGRDVMEKYLGRKLFPKETVHHKNGIKVDDSISNLELWTSRHPKGQRVRDQINWAIDLLKQYNIDVIFPVGIDKILEQDSVSKNMHIENKDNIPSMINVG